jgi:ankyrin repeat domain-containing protein 50
VLELPGENFIIADALDECSYGAERTQLSTVLKEFSTWALPNLHILVTSRKEPDIEKALAPLVTSSPVCIQTKQVDADILLYVKSQLENDANLRERTRIPQLKEEIETTLVKGANGMYGLLHQFQVRLLIFLPKVPMGLLSIRIPKDVLECS